MKNYLIAAAIVLLLGGAVVVQQKRIAAVRRENRTLSRNVSALLETAETYRVRDSLHAAGIGALELKASEYERFRAEDARLIDELHIRLKRAESIAKSATESRYEITTVVRDTVVVSENRADTARTFSHRTPYIELDGVLRPDTVEVSIVTRDTLLQVVHRVPRRFLFIRYGTKAIRQEVVSTNPHTEITYHEYIRLRK
jgi:hypothetical protein